ncbi:cobalt ECF transporter T component CbiQ [Anaerophilus nitritogenes]|uniref:cobalt ECF transporter T component CbiQ n=1 Tax=Anaerophilus nitritogenes TaxID=2498136 RepID=UPI00101BEC3F|nr:cobalt ECF transporter T component CbiQ [Anaerophilus nitritogenes]
MKRIKYKFLGFLIMIFSFASIQKMKWIPFMIGITLITWIVFKVPFKVFLKRIKIPFIFVGMMNIIYLFFTNGDLLIQSTYFNITYQGLEHSLLFTSRFLCIFSMSILFFHTTSYVDVIKIMRMMGMPSILTDLFLFTYRYIFELGRQMETMHRAMYMRGMKRSFKDIKTMSSLLGSTFVRSYEQAQRVYDAMHIRGYGR